MGAFKIFSKFAQLLDKATVDLPTVNTPLSTALGLKMVKTSNLSDVANAATAATNLGLGTASNVTHADITATGDVTATSATSSEPVVLIENTNTDSAGAKILIYKNTASPAVNDTIGSLNFQSKNNQGSGRVYANITARIHDPVNATLTGELKFNVYSAGSYVTVLTLLDGNAGIGTTTPGEKLDVVGNIKASGTVKEGVYTVATTPTHVLGAAIRISDDNGTSVGSVVSGGGSAHVVARSTGSSWVCTAIIIPV